MEVAGLRCPNSVTLKTESSFYVVCQDMAVGASRLLYLESSRNQALQRIFLVVAEASVNEQPSIQRFILALKL
jgi:hypothetical protein